MSRYSRHNPDEPIRHDWTAGGRKPEEKTASALSEADNYTCDLEIVLAAERALNDFVENLVKAHSLEIRSVFEPLPITASEQQLYNILRERLEKAKAGYRNLERLRRR